MTEMPKITKCDVVLCGYNKESQCNALAINVGGSGPICNAFLGSTVKCATNRASGGVSACKVKNCRFNDCFICAAPEIYVGLDKGQAECSTFQER